MNYWKDRAYDSEYSLSRKIRYLEEQIKKLENQPMKTEEYLWTVVAEECAEVTQRITKILRFGIDEIGPKNIVNNKEMFEQEFNDLLAVVEMIYGGIIPTNSALQEQKKQKVKKYMEYSRELGLLE